jgi:carbon monoxide dehydrogenase subunit G
MNFQTSIQVDADPARTFAAFTDLRNAATNIRGIKHIEVLTDGPVRAGTQFRETRTMFGRDAEEKMEVTAFDPPRSYSVGCDSCGGVRFDTEFRFTPEAGGTRVDVNMTTVATSIFAKMMTPLMGWMMAGTMRKCFEDDLADIKAVAEGRIAAAPTA